MNSNIVERAHQSSSSSRNTDNKFKTPEVSSQVDENNSISDKSVVQDQQVTPIDSSVQVTASNIEAVATKVLNIPGVLNSSEVTQIMDIDLDNFKIDTSSLNLGH